MQPLALPDHVPDGVVVDIGGTKVMVGVVGEGVLLEVASFRTRELHGPQAIAEIISSTGLHLARRNGVKIRSVAVSVPGILDRQAGIVVRSANLPFNEFPLGPELSRQLGGVPVALEHDANCGVVGEAAFGAGRGMTSLVYFTVSTGIGMGTLVDGRLLEGAHGAAGEIGHAPVMAAGRDCTCGSVGCLEAYASGGAMANLGRQAFATGQSSVLASLAASERLVTAREVVMAAHLGDRLCAEIVAQAVQLLVVAIRMVIGVLDPDRVLLGGGVMGNELFAGRVIASLKASGDEFGRVRPALLGARSAISGVIEFLSETRHDRWRDIAVPT
jgi:glucokinase